MDARYIVERAFKHETNELTCPGLRTGMVLGSVQSGKTASMLGVAALALDQGAELVVLLAGTRVGLWLQTYERLLLQLDGSTLETAYRRSHARLLLPQPDDVLRQARADPTSYLQRQKARQALDDGKPILFVVPKEDDHLLLLGRFLKEVLDPVLKRTTSPLRLLILDDEADDASVLDSSQSMKITPRYIASLWSGSTSSADVRDQLAVTYIAYTATPQANYLQATHNPLAPRDFHTALRTPSFDGVLSPRQITYLEPQGVPKYYCGGEIFYRRVPDGPAALCQKLDAPERQAGESEEEFLAREEKHRWDMISEALRCYFVGGALRLHFHNRTFTEMQAQAPYSDLPELLSKMPSAHTMLFHPSSRKDVHLQAAIDLVRWSIADPGCEGGTCVPHDELGRPILNLSAEGLAARLESEEDLWKGWLTKFEATRVALSDLPKSGQQPISSELWPRIKELLIQEVFPNVTLRVINSDPNSDDRPQFEPLASKRSFLPAPDIYSIFVAGNVLSRGLTLEGLCTSLFVRTAAEPAADTQMQMQRWFGYRGSHLSFCRVFTYRDQADLFAAYHVNDLALRERLIGVMNAADPPDTSIVVLEGENFVATSKVDSRKTPLNPGPNPSVRLIERAMPHRLNNLGALTRILEQGSWESLLDDRGNERGRIRSETASLAEVAALLDDFRYDVHDPSLSLELSRRWDHYAQQLGLDEPLFRPPGLNPGPYYVEPQSCPYSIAAYLRLWSALLENPALNGFYPTNQPSTPWKYAGNKTDDAPPFYLAVRNGTLPPENDDLRRAHILAMDRGIEANRPILKTLWGSRTYSGSYYGDEYVDYYFHRSTPVPSLMGTASWRPVGHPGLVLFHVVKDPVSAHDLVTVGLGIPHGGPDHIAALRA
jgi:hypothetical protein